MSISKLVLIAVLSVQPFAAYAGDVFSWDERWESNQAAYEDLDEEYTVLDCHGEDGYQKPQCWEIRQKKLDILAHLLDWFPVQ